MKLNVKAFALAAGIVWGINWFGLTWWIIAFDGITREPTFIGLMYGFVDGFLIGLMVAWTYNKISPHLQSKKE